jgi:hypothetical protein
MDMSTTQTKETIRCSEDASICMVQRVDGSLECPTQEDMDRLPLGADLTAEEIDGLDS